jgi:hypothetical protein
LYTELPVVTRLISLEENLGTPSGVVLASNITARLQVLESKYHRMPVHVPLR